VYVCVGADEKPWSDKSVAEAISSDADDDDDDDDDEDSAADTDEEYTQRHDDDDEDTFDDYVRVQLPMQGHGDNVANSQLTANQVYTQLSSRPSHSTQPWTVSAIYRQLFWLAV